MNRELVIGLLLLLVVGITFLHASALVLAQDDDSDNSGSGPDNDDDRDDDSDDDNSGSRNSDDDDEDDRDDDRDDDDEREDDDDDNSGPSEKDETRIRIKDGETKIETRKRVVDEDGNVREVRIKIEEKVKSDGTIERKIRIRDKTQGDIEVKSDVKLREEYSAEDNVTSILAELSNGDDQEISVTPERVREIARQRLGSDNLSLEIKEVEHRNIPRVVYNVETNKNGKFLGVFKLAMKVEGEIDPETGEVLEVNKPWWAFLVVGEEDDQTNEEVDCSSLDEQACIDHYDCKPEYAETTCEGDNCSDEETYLSCMDSEDEIEEELEQDIEWSAETLGNTSELKIKIEFDTLSEETSVVYDELLAYLDVDAEAVAAQLSMESADEAPKEEAKLEIDVDDVTEVKFEYRFILDSAEADVIASALAARAQNITANDLAEIQAETYIFP